MGQREEEAEILKCMGRVKSEDRTWVWQGSSGSSLGLVSDIMHVNDVGELGLITP